MPRKTKRAAPTKPSRAVTARLEKDTLAYAAALNGFISRNEKSIISYYVPHGGALDSFDPLDTTFEEFSAWYATFDAFMRAESGVEFVLETAKKRWLQSIMQTLGVSTIDLLKDPAIGVPFNNAVTAYMGYFERYGADTMQRLKNAAMKNFTGQRVPEGSLQNYIKKLYAGNIKRAKFAAAEINATYTATFSRLRSQSIGCRTYDWMTAGDRLVVGAGVWPPSPSHGNHYLRAGRTYSYEQKHHDGHPGEAIGCRCMALPNVPTSPSELINLAFV